MKQYLLPIKTSVPITNIHEFLCKFFCLVKEKNLMVHEFNILLITKDLDMRNAF